jgi:thioredoxin-like negative regulator of GroEL
MSIEYAINPKDGWEDQVGLRMRCTSAEAQAIHRALRALFRGRMSPVMPSHDRDYNYTIFVPAAEETLTQKWPEVLRLAAIPTPTAEPQPKAQPAPYHAQPRSAQQQPQAARAAPTAAVAQAAWERQFREAVKLVIASEVIPTTRTAGVASGMNNASLDDDETLLAGLPPLSRLRARIAQYARRQQYANIVALCAEQRQDVLALPASALLVSQLLEAHVTLARETGDETLEATGRELVRDFLPELERLRQADEIRVKLQAGRSAPSTGEQDAQTTLHEQLASLVEVAPVERVHVLEQLRARYPQSTAIRIALADTFAVLGETDRALELYRSQRAEASVLDRVVELLLTTGRYREALLELADCTALSPRLTGLRGAALAALGDTAQARPLLEQAWEANERSPLIALPLARVLAQANDLERAAEPYQIAFEITPEALNADDLRIMADIALGGGFGDLSNEEQAVYLDRYIAHIGRRLRETPKAVSALKLRVDLRRAAEYPERLQESLADWLEYLAETANRSELDAATALLRDLRRKGAITYQTQFELLEGIEQLASAAPGLGDLLALEYQAIALDELALSLRQSRPLPAYIADIRRALHFLNRQLADELAVEIEHQRQALLERNLPVPEQVIEAAQPLDLADISLTIVGGHSATRREVERELREQYGLRDYLEIAPSSEGHIDRNLVRDRLVGRTLIVVITGYTGHDLTNLVRDVHQAGSITGQLIWPKSRGKSGVVRAIVEVCKPTATG